MKITFEAYIKSELPKSFGDFIFIESSDQFKTREEYRAWLKEKPEYEGLKFKIVRAIE
jgi:hypothetical protein